MSIGNFVPYMPPQAIQNPPQQPITTSPQAQQPVSIAPPPQAVSLPIPPAQPLPQMTYAPQIQVLPPPPNAYPAAQLSQVPVQANPAEPVKAQDVQAAKPADNKVEVETNLRVAFSMLKDLAQQGKLPPRKTWKEDDLKKVYTEAGLNQNMIDDIFKIQPSTPEQESKEFIAVLDKYKY